MHGLTESAMFPDSRAPWVVEPTSGTAELAETVAEHRDALDERLLEHGAVLLRGFRVASVEQFARFGAAVSSEALDYVYRSTPRTSVGDGVFTTTEYPAEQEIALHCENAYQREWPLKVAFCCLVAPAAGGETPIADMRKVTAAVGPEILAAFQERGVRYVRHYRPHIDIPWEVVFQTSDRAEVAEYCHAHGIDHEWLDEDTLRTAQTAQGTAEHPVTGEHVFFNQAHLFHVSSLGREVAASLIDLFGADRLPRNACHGDGTPIPDDHLTKVREAFSRSSVQFRWAPGDVLLLDNMQTAHGRRPYSGARRVVATLLDLHSAQQTTPTTRSKA